MFLLLSLVRIAFLPTLFSPPILANQCLCGYLIKLEADQIGMNGVGKKRMEIPAELIEEFARGNGAIFVGSTLIF